MSEPTESRTGACLCGKIKYQLQGKAAKPLHNTVCHCLSCQRITGSALLAASIASKEGFSITQGEDALKSHADTKSDSGQPLTRKFCSECGSRLFAFTPLNENIVMIAAGTLDDFEDWRPSKEQYCVHRLGFVDKMKGVESQDRHVTNMRSEAE
ncbi:hypothetical protein LTR35_013540 [Friedmanniomyces endolithicus]|uniref:CENP-V/GFA domain-containing protein n=1 Tax=Friedmanniomyces endolithicus TaxID=329885 RepID=A0AAN6FZB2_9PEZI|nr:hypothetical protein LTR35_013540 [Friedmanniomyces endolithicus]KAK0277317.1 hypothetical protein LTS00_014150 [Friedmanniomyces endolithicus]KAK0325684.1 hypothetical protein LTR82_003221 [Friedmanniomyces endolithicus]KAK0972247.1 hypothetical protein LTR54_017612 [Friedmanniomyces endolithicus]